MTSKESWETMKAWELAMEPWDTPFFNRLPSYDPYKGLPRKDIKGTHPYRAKLYRSIGGFLYGIATKLSKVNEWLEWHSDSTFQPEYLWSDHSVVDWDQVSPEERKRRTTITFGMAPLKDVDAE